MVTPWFAEPTSQAVPLVVLAQDEFPRWLRLPAAAKVRSWVEKTAFEPRPRRHLVIHRADGSPELVVVIASDPPSMWDLACLARSLPPFSYALRGGPGAASASGLAVGWALGAYEFTRYRTSFEGRPAGSARHARLVWPSSVESRAVQRTVEAVCLVRDLVNTPSSDMGPAELAAASRKLTRPFGATVQVTTGQALLNRNSYYPMVHAVGRASTREPRLIDIRWGRKRRPCVTLVGKGVCFDSGGLSIKPFEEMLGMKIDMAGAAHALALATMIMDAKLDVNLRVLIPAVENAISGNAYRPLDVLTSRKGLTVEIGSTDAEGRLILADALTAADEESPVLLVDFGTLTSFEAGAGLMGAFFTRDEEKARLLQTLSSELEDPLWRMPLTPLIAPRLRGKVADLTNTGSIYKGSTLRAAMFLSHFVERAQSWVHVDLPDGNEEDRPGRPMGGEAFGVRALFAMIEHMFAPGQEK